jgi:hypothetical protein
MKVLKELRKLDDQFRSAFPQAMEIEVASAAGLELKTDHLISLNSGKKEKEIQSQSTIERIHYEMSVENREKPGKMAVIATVLGIVNLVGLTALVTWLWRKARKQRKRVEGISRNLSQDKLKVKLGWGGGDQIRGSSIRRLHPREFSQECV